MRTSPNYPKAVFCTHFFAVQVAFRVDIMTKLKPGNPWRNSLIIATGLNALAFAAYLLWQAGQAEWGFALLFGVSWVLISLLLSNDNFNEESGVILAGILDENVDHLQARIEQLERALSRHDEPGPAFTASAASVH
jgi:thiol:disulfide interchange protein